jgi:nucleotide-binding universal stress UspA family protein
MKKILLAIDGAHMNKEALNFACFIATLTHSSLTGVFLNKHEETVAVMKATYGMPYVETIVAGDLPDYATKQKAREENILLFEQTCGAKGVRSQVHINGSNVPSKTVIDESRFVDLVIVSVETSFENKFEGAPTVFVKDVLAGAECPVMVAPLSFCRIDQIVFAYDGSRSAVFAIKQFTYLFPELTDKKAIILQVNKEVAIPLTEKEKMGGLLKMHYSGIGFRILNGKAANELFNFLQEKKNTMIVMGAYGRGWLSGLFRPSSAGALLKSVNLPFFITHH